MSAFGVGSDPYFSTFWVNTEMYSVSLHIQFYSEKKNCTRKTAWSVRIRSYSGPYFPAFGLNTERYSVSLRFQPECGKMQTRIIPNTTLFTQCFTHWSGFVVSLYLSCHKKNVPCNLQGTANGGNFHISGYVDRKSVSGTVSLFP